MTNIGEVNMKWEQDLVRDIRTGTEYDDRDTTDSRIPHPDPSGWPWEEVTDANRQAIKERFLKVRDNCKAILEIGVCRNEKDSITHIFLDNKLDETVYVGIDLDDKSFLNNPDKNIWTIQGSSSSVPEAMEIFKQLGITEFGFIFIDGWHSINQVMTDWEYTQMLSTNGIVGLHDVSSHPGPALFIKALNKDIWEVEENTCPRDHGVGFAWKK
jgi:hypothetical protein